MSNQALWMMGIIITLGGAASVIGYEHWSFNYQGLITLLGWGSLIKGAAILFLPGYVNKFMKWAIKDHIYLISIVLGIIIGAYLLYAGFSA